MATKIFRTTGYGQNVALPELTAAPIVTVRNPTIRDRGFIGQIWINRTTNNWWILTSVVANISTWTQSVNGGGIFATLEATAIGGILADTGPIVATLGNISAVGGNIIANAGSVTAGAGLVATAGGVTSVGNVSMTAGDINIASDATAHPVNIGTGAAQRAIVVGNSSGNTSIALNVGTGALNLGVNGIAHIVTLGNIIGATAVNVNTGTAGSTITTTNGIFRVLTGTGQIDISSDAAATTVNLGIGNAVKTVVVGSTNTASATTIQSGTGDVTISSSDALDMNITGAATLDSASISLDATTTSNLTVTGASADLDLYSVGGSINIVASEAAADAIAIDATNAAGGITIIAGTAGTTVANTNGVFTVHTGTGTISIGNDATDKTITVGTATGVSAVNVLSGTGAVNITAPSIILNGLHILNGAGDPGAPLATEIGALYVRNDAVSAVTRIFVASAIGTWVNVTCSA